jgi:type I restriction enzyme S subunit
MLIRRGDFSSGWLCYLINSRTVRFQVETVQYGAAQEQFNISHGINFMLPCPPPEEQQEIEINLNQEAARLDALADAATKAIALLQERRAALISAAVTGKIDVRNLAPAAAEAA